MPIPAQPQLHGAEIGQWCSRHHDDPNDHDDHEDHDDQDDHDDHDGSAPPPSVSSVTVWPSVQVVEGKYRDPVTIFYSSIIKETVPRPD